MKLEVQYLGKRFTPPFLYDFRINRWTDLPDPHESTTVSFTLTKAVAQRIKIAKGEWMVFSCDDRPEFALRLPSP